MLNIYTDGGCRGNGNKKNIGAWGFIFVIEDEVLTSNSGVEYNTTNNRMELLAIINAIAEAYRQEKNNIIINTDSMYSLNGITNWIHKWKTNNWKTANKKDVINQDLWKKLDSLVKKGNVKFLKVKAHSINKYNNMVDKLLNKTMDKENI